VLDLGLRWNCKCRQRQAGGHDKCAESGNSGTKHWRPLDLVDGMVRARLMVAARLALQEACQTVPGSASAPLRGRTQLARKDQNTIRPPALGVGWMAHGSAPVRIPDAPV